MLSFDEKIPLKVYGTPQYLSSPGEAIKEMSTVQSGDVLPRKGRQNLAEASLISAQKCPRSNESPIHERRIIQ